MKTKVVTCLTGNRLQFFLFAGCLIWLLSNWKKAVESQLLILQYNQPLSHEFWNHLKTLQHSLTSKLLGWKQTGFGWRSGRGHRSELLYLSSVSLVIHWVKLISDWVSVLLHKSSWPQKKWCSFSSPLRWTRLGTNNLLCCWGVLRKLHICLCNEASARWHLIRSSALVDAVCAAFPVW